MVGLGTSSKMLKLVWQPNHAVTLGRGTQIPPFKICDGWPPLVHAFEPYALTDR